MARSAAPRGCRSRGAAAPALALTLAASALPGARGFVRELFTTNAVCAPRYCVNPVFPALEQLPDMEARRWAKQTTANVSRFMSFCGRAIDYDIAVPMVGKGASPMAGLAVRQRLEKAQQEFEKGQPGVDYEAAGVADPLRDSVAMMDRAAARSFFLHLSGMGIEAWDHADPFEDTSSLLSSCAKSVAELACYTHFPKAASALLDGQEVEYRRPCRSSCQSYLQACGVQCCDEGVSCVWGGAAAAATGGAAASQGPVRTMGQGGAEVLLQAGYVDAEGPHWSCTGA